MKREELITSIIRMQKETQEGKLNWDLKVQTTEGITPKFIVSEDGISYEMDECYVSYICKSKDSEFCMITYEMIKKNEDGEKTNNYVFIPPAGIRFFSLATLLPYSIEADQMLIHQIHSLWNLLMERRKAEDPKLTFSITEESVSMV